MFNLDPDEYEYADYEVEVEYDDLEPNLQGIPSQTGIIGNVDINSDPSPTLDEVTSIPNVEPENAKNEIITEKDDKTSEIVTPIQNIDFRYENIKDNIFWHEQF